MLSQAQCSSRHPTSVQAYPHKGSFSADSARMVCSTRHFPADCRARNETPGTQMAPRARLPESARADGRTSYRHRGTGDGDSVQYVTELPVRTAPGELLANKRTRSLAIGHACGPPGPGESASASEITSKAGMNQRRRWRGSDPKVYKGRLYVPTSYHTARLPPSTSSALHSFT